MSSEAEERELDFSPLVIHPGVPWYAGAVLVATLTWPLLVVLGTLRKQTRASIDPTIAHLLLLWPLTLNAGITWLRFGELLGQIAAIGPMSGVVAAGIAEALWFLALALAASAVVCLVLVTRVKVHDHANGSAIAPSKGFPALTLPPIAAFTACFAVGGLIFALRFAACAILELERARALSWTLAILGVSVWCLTSVVLLQAFRQSEAERTAFAAVSRGLLAKYLVALLLGFGLVTSLVGHFRSLAIAGSVWFCH